MKIVYNQSNLKKTTDEAIMLIKLNINKKELKELKQKQGRKAIVVLKTGVFYRFEIGKIDDFQVENKKECRVKLNERFEKLIQDKGIDYLNYLSIYEDRGSFVFEVKTKEALTKKEIKEIHEYFLK